MTKGRDAVKGINCVVVLLLDVSIVFRYHNMNLKKQTLIGLNTRSYISKDYILLLGIEILMCSMVSPPGFNNVHQAKMLGGTYEFKLDSFMAILSLIKAYHFIRLYTHYSVWLSDETQHICKRFGFIPNFYFVIKTELKQRPFKILFLALTILSLLAALIIQACERTFDPYDHKYQDYNYIMNPIWLCFVTMTTVGYGDFYPRTHMGRIAGVIVCLFGMISISLLVIFLQSLIEFNPKEQKYYQDCKKYNDQMQYQKRAGKVMLSAFKLKMSIKKLRKKEADSLLKQTITFLQLKNFIKTSTSFNRETQRRGNMLQLSVEEVLQNIESKIAFDLDKLCQKLDGLPRMSERIRNISVSSVLDKDMI